MHVIEKINDIWSGYIKTNSMCDEIIMVKNSSLGTHKSSKILY